MRRSPLALSAIALHAAALSAALFIISPPALAGEQVIPLDGELAPAEPAHVLIPFEVPSGTLEIEVTHESLNDKNVIDWGVLDPNGFRGWGGGNAEPAVIGELAASRSYLTGPISPGTWHVVVGKADLNELPAAYKLTVTLRDAPTLAPQKARAPYAPAPALEKGPRWYAGDFHVHSIESGDALPPLDEIAQFARAKGLDFVEISDHNTVSQLDFFNDAQSRSADLLFLPGIEYTTYAGHANAVGATKWVDHKIGLPGVTIEGAAQAVADQGALFSINHPVLDIGDLCIGCAWKHDLPASAVHAVEIATGGFEQSGFLFDEPAIAFWDALCATGRHVAAIGGSDDHRAGVDLGSFQSPIGDPTTMVYAEELSVSAIIEGVRNGRTVVKLQGPGDPMIELSSTAAPSGDTIAASRTRIQAVVRGGAGNAFLFVRNGEPLEKVLIDADPFTREIRVDAPLSGEDRYRAEVHIDGKPRTVTSHLWLHWAPYAPPEPPQALEGAGGGDCSCSAPGAKAPASLGALFVAMGAGAAAVLWRMRRRRF
jgi:hypothetical protein